METIRQARLERTEREADIAPSGYFQTADGVTLGYRAGGNPSGPPLLFCYGLMCSSFHFKYQWEHFARDHRLLVLDYRGHHISRFPAALTTLNFPRLADDLDEFLEHVGERRPACVVGHSMGVNLALELYERHPGRVSSLVLMSGTANFPARGRGAAARLRGLNAAMKIVDGLFPRFADAFWRTQARAPGADRFAGFVGFNTGLAKPEDIRKVVELMSGFSPRVFAQLLGEYLRHDRSDTAARVDVPTLVISGDSDRAVAAAYHRELHELIPGSRLVSIEGGSHCPQFDRPDEINAVLRAFLKTPRS